MQNYLTAERFRVECSHAEGFSPGKHTTNRTDTMITEYTTTSCPRCAGRGKLPEFSHNKGGECFKCSGSGKLHIAATRDLTDSEVFAALAASGLPLMPQESPEAADWFAGLFGSNDAEVIAGARILANLLPLTFA